MEIPEIDLSKVKHKKGKPLTVEEAKSVVKVFYFLAELFNKQKRGEILRLRHTTELTSKATGYGTATVKRIMAMFHSVGDVNMWPHPPLQTRIGRPPSIVKGQYIDIIVRGHIYSQNRLGKGL